MNKPTPPPTQMIREGENPGINNSTFYIKFSKDWLSDNHFLYPTEDIESIQPSDEAYEAVMRIMEKAFKEYKNKEHASKQDYIIKPHRSI